MNSPAYWPEITWACMGGGCLVSTSRELFRWYRSLAAGKILSPQTLASAFSSQPGLRLSAGGNDFGFGTVVAEERSRRDLVIILSNSAAGTSWEQLAPDLAKVLARWESRH